MRTGQVITRLKSEVELLYSTRKQSQNGKRNTGLDMARGIAIILIVIGHSSFVDGVPAVWLSTFHLPAFFLLSGWLLAMKQASEGDVKQQFLRRLRNIMIPYFWFSAGSLLLDLVQVWRGSFTMDILLQHLFETVSLQGYSVMWFLPVLLLAEFGAIGVYTILRRNFHANGSRMYVVAAVFWTLISVGGYFVYKRLETCGTIPFLLAELRIPVKAMIGAAFISYGALLSNTVVWIDKKKKINPVFWGMAGMVLILLNIVAAFWVPHMDLNNLNVGFLPQYLLLGTCGSLGLVWVFRVIPNFPVLTFYGQNSLIIMSTHLNFYIMYLAIRITDVTAMLLGSMPQGAWICVMLILTLVLEIPVILLIRIFAPFVLGKSQTRKAEKGEVVM